MPARLRLHFDSLFLVLAALLLAGCGPSMSPLHQAVIEGNLSAIREAAAKGRDLNLRYDEKPRGLEGNYARRIGVTPLMLAAGMGRLDAVQLLVEGGADVHAQSNTQVPGTPRTAFDDAVDANQVAIARYLWEHSDKVRLAARLEEQISASCRTWCQNGGGRDAQTNLVLFLISIAGEPQRGLGVGRALCFADPAGRARAFLAARVSPFPKDTLHCPAFDGTSRATRSFEQRAELIDWLLARGADLESMPVSYTPLMGAASTQDVAMVKWLLARGAKPDTRNRDGVTAIGVAAGSCVLGGPTPEVEQRMQPQLEVVQALAQAGASTALYTPELIRTRVPLLAQCCARQPQPAAQQRICKVFGL